MKSRHIILSFFVIVISYLLPVHSCYAHVGGGPPFLEVNGQYANTNPFFSNDPTINVPQDTNPYTNPVIVGEPIRFVIDTQKLLVPPDIAEQTTYRWSFSDGSSDYKYGQKLTYTYQKPGSFLITIDAKAPGETDFLTIDTVQVDILPYKNYQLPKATIQIETTNRKTTLPIAFIAKVKTDNAAHITSMIWGFGDETAAHSLAATHTYKDINNFSTFPVIFRVIDNYGFITDTGVIVQSKDQKFHFYDEQGKENTIPVSNSITEIKKESSSSHFPSWIMYVVCSIIIVSFIMIISLRKKSNSK